MIEPVVFGFGGNIGTDVEIVGRFRRARDALSALGSVESAPLYRSAPIGPAQPAYLNTAACVRISDIEPDELIGTIQELERVLGRERHFERRWGPRTIDLDVLMWGARIVRTAELDIPHPRLYERRFALAPLVDLLGGDVPIPGVGTAGERLRSVADQVIEQIATDW